MKVGIFLEGSRYGWSLWSWLRSYKAVGMGCEFFLKYDMRFVKCNSNKVLIENLKYTSIEINKNYILASVILSKRGSTLKGWTNLIEAVKYLAHFSQ